VASHGQFKVPQLEGHRGRSFPQYLTSFLIFMKDENLLFKRGLSRSGGLSIGIVEFIDDLKTFEKGCLFKINLKFSA